MYQQHFNFTSPPFSIAPNPRFVYLSPQHSEALAHLLYGIGAGGGFIALTGEVGTGKTTLCRCLLERLPQDVDIALVFNPRLNARQLLASICDELRIPHPEQKASIKQLIDLLNHHLLETHARGRRTVVLIDEAQNLSFDVLEQIRLLTNLETNESKLLQIILVGQPELNVLLARQNLRQLSQRITARYHLRPLSLPETAAYIRYRLAVSGVERELFSYLAVARIYRMSGGIPRLINLVCDRALLGAYSQGKHRVGLAIVGKAAREVLPERRGSRRLRPAFGALAVLSLLSLGGMFYFGAGYRFGSISLRQLSPAWLGNSGQPASAALLAVENRPEKTAIDASAEAPAEKPASAAVDAQPKRQAPKPKHESPAEPGMAPVVEPLPAAAKFADFRPAEQASVLPVNPRPPLSAADEADFAALIADPGLTRSAAFSGLFALWGVSASKAVAEECLFAKQNGLRCLENNDSWSQLRSLNLPAMLEFVLPDGAKRYVNLTKVKGGKLVLGLGARTYTLEAERMLPFWRGTYLVLWKPPIDHPRSIRIGEKSEAVRWLRQRLGVPAAAAKEQLFDANLKARVIDFQQKHGLKADGAAGPLTVIQLQKIAGNLAGPKLGEGRL